MNRSRAAEVTAVFSLLVTSVNAMAQAQADTPTQGESPATADTETMEAITVTGSLLPSRPDQIAVPVISLDSKQLEQNGVTSNALELLRKAVPSFAGRSNAGTSNANNDNQRTAGGSQLQLRNLPTLILVNGAGLPTAAWAASMARIS